MVFQVRSSLKAEGKKLWEDPNVPASDSSLDFTESRPDYLPAGIEWKRPSELSKQPALVTEGVSKFDVHQGHLGDCWFLAPLTALTTNPALYARVRLYFLNSMIGLNQSDSWVFIVKISKYQKQILLLPYNKKLYSIYMDILLKYLKLCL